LRITVQPTIFLDDADEQADDKFDTLRGSVAPAPEGLTLLP
jgi:hypothetical protein